jgi:hypothetical protein
VARQAAVWAAWVVWATWTSKVVEQDPSDPEFDIKTSRLLRREALRRAAEELNTTSPRGLEDVLARISAEVTADANDRIANDNTPPI